MPTPLAPEEAYVLVIEDDPNNLMVVTDLLRMVGINPFARSSSFSQPQVCAPSDGMQNRASHPWIHCRLTH